MVPGADAILARDRACDAAYIRHALRTPPNLAPVGPRNTKHVSGLGRWRCVVDRTFAWLESGSPPPCAVRETTRHALGIVDSRCILICWKFPKHSTGGDCPVSLWSTQHNLGASHNAVYGRKNQSGEVPSVTPAVPTTRLRRASFGACSAVMGQCCMGVS